MPRRPTRTCTTKRMKLPFWKPSCLSPRRTTMKKWMPQKGRSRPRRQRADHPVPKTPTLIRAPRPTPATATAPPTTTIRSCCFETFPKRQPWPLDGTRRPLQAPPPLPPPPKRQSRRKLLPPNHNQNPKRVRNKIGRSRTRRNEIHRNQVAGPRNPPRMV